VTVCESIDCERVNEKSSCAGTLVHCTNSILAQFPAANIDIVKILKW